MQLLRSTRPRSCAFGTHAVVDFSAGGENSLVGLFASLPLRILRYSWQHLQLANQQINRTPLTRRPVITGVSGPVARVILQ